MGFLLGTVFSFTAHDVLNSSANWGKGSRLLVGGEVPHRPNFPHDFVTRSRVKGDLYHFRTKGGSFHDLQARFTYSEGFCQGSDGGLVCLAIMSLRRNSHREFLPYEATHRSPGCPWFYPDNQPDRVRIAHKMILRRVNSSMSTLER